MRTACPLLLLLFAQASLSLETKGKRSLMTLRSRKQASMSGRYQSGSSNHKSCTATTKCINLYGGQLRYFDDLGSVPAGDISGLETLTQSSKGGKALFDKVSPKSRIC